MELRKIPIDGKMYDVSTYEEYYNNPEMYDDRRTAIMDKEHNVALPILTKTDTVSKGIRFGGLVSEVNIPEDEQYSLDNMIDMSNPTDYKEAIEQSQRLKDAEREILLNVDNQTIPVIGENDTPHMKGLKMAVAAKQCDINSYSDKFGSNFANERRIMDSDDTTIKKIKKYGESMDFDVYMTFKDKSPDVPNPMRKEITVKITGNNMDGGDIVVREV